LLVVYAPVDLFMLTSHWYLYGGAPPYAPASVMNPYSSWSITGVFVTGVATYGAGGIVDTVSAFTVEVGTVVTLIVLVEDSVVNEVVVKDVLVGTEVLVVGTIEVVIMEVLVEVDRDVVAVLVDEGKQVSLVGQIEVVV